MQRRPALILFINSVAALIGGGLAAVLGAFAAGASRSGDRPWVKAGAVADLTPHVPVPRVISVARQDGWYRERARATVFVVWDGDRSVHALSATCTHLGCQVRWDAPSTTFRCPCHGGIFDAEGQVVAGPPPRALDRVDARIDAVDQSVVVRL